MLPIRWLAVDLGVPGSRAAFEHAAAFWCTVTGSSPQPRDGVLLQPPGGAPYLHLRHLPSDDAPPGHPPADGQSQFQIQLAAGSSLDHAQAGALALGAVLAGRDGGVARLQSPGGYAFSIRVTDEAAPQVTAPQVTAPAELGTGGLNRADQVCLDIPPQLHDAEQAFWPALTGWPLRGGSRPEFSYLERAPGIPLRILLQRRDQADPADRVTGHLDFASADRVALAQEHLAAGATLVGRWERWIALRDPAGQIYCITGRTPE